MIHGKMDSTIYPHKMGAMLIQRSNILGSFLICVVSVFQCNFTYLMPISGFVISNEF